MEEKKLRITGTGKNIGGTSGSPSMSHHFPELLTEEELIDFLRIPLISNATNFHNVVENLKRMHDLPRIHICGKPLYPLEAIKEWIKNNTIKE